MVKFGLALHSSAIRYWKPYYINYTRLKGWIKETESNQSEDAVKVFFEELSTNLKRVDGFYRAQETVAQQAIEDLSQKPYPNCSPE